MAVRFVAADTHPDHDTVATFRREHQAAFAAAFASVLEIARELALFKVGMMSVDEAGAGRLPREVARREALKAKRDAARARLGGGWRKRMRETRRTEAAREKYK